MEELYHAALPLTVAEREEFLAQQCANDTVLQEDVRSLLNSDDLLANFLEEPVAELGAARCFCGWTILRL
jgi:hypothetical protein